MQQDVTADGSLHTSEPRTLASWRPSHVSPNITPFSWKQHFLQTFPSTPRWLLCRRFPSRYSRSVRFSPAAPLIGPLISIYTCVYISRSIELGIATRWRISKKQPDSAHWGINRHKSGESSYESLHFAAQRSAACLLVTATRSVACIWGRISGSGAESERRH